MISIFAARIAAGLPVALHGDGEQIRDFVFVLDVVRNLIAAMALLGKVPQAAVLNLCTGRATSIRELAENIGQAAGKAASLRAGPARAGDIRASVGNPGAALALFGLSASTSLREGLHITLAALAIPRREAA